LTEGVELTCYVIAAIRAAIASTDYQGSVQVNFAQQRSVVTVYPDNQLSRWLAKVCPWSVSDYLD
jgi:hypothetical protein